ncbi:SEC-C metal-binding domain-containing protein [Zhongshania sp.]|uniref:SEC-C metal-binding domain-containing protein n=1 Tax=Zhongshania sp. TaxID=1971902 RepID=UPI0039E55923
MSNEINTPIPQTLTNIESGCSDRTCCSSTTPVTRTAPKVGRNEPCPCGNGRKFKKCCGQSL